MLMSYHIGVCNSWTYSVTEVTAHTSVILPQTAVLLLSSYREMLALVPSPDYRDANSHPLGLVSVGNLRAHLTATIMETSDGLIHSVDPHWTLTNPNSLRPELVQISETSDLVSVYIWNAHQKIAMDKMMFGYARVQIWISVGPLYIRRAPNVLVISPCCNSVIAW